MRDRREQMSLVVCVRRVVAMFYDAGLQSGDILLKSETWTNCLSCFVKQYCRRHCVNFRSRLVPVPLDFRIYSVSIHSNLK
jgi:hypothetical protein